MTRNTGPGSGIIAGISVTNNGDFHSTPLLPITDDGDIADQTKGYDGMNKYTPIGRFLRYFFFPIRFDKNLKERQLVLYL